MSPIKKIKDDKYTYAGFCGTTKVNFKHTIGIDIAKGLKYEESKLIGIRIYNRYNGRYAVHQTGDNLGNFTLTLQLPNTLRADKAREIVEVVRNSVPEYLNIIRPFIAK